MSAIKDSDPFAEWYGYTEWPGSEPSTEETSAPEPLDQIGATVVCPGCQRRMAKRGYPHHYRRDHAGKPR